MTSTTVIASEARQPIPVWLTLLAHLYPPKGTLLIGAGAGNSPWVKHLQTENHPNVTLVEADEAKATRLKTTTQNQPHWQVKHHVIAQHTAPTPFYTASLQTESGLLEPESMRSHWPNLKTTDQQTRQAVSLAELQADAEIPANWLLVDCLPALPILQGAAQQLAAFDVIALRVLLNNTQDTANDNDNDNAHNELTQSASANALQPALQALGFRCLAIETSRHPAIGHALFVRDIAALAQQLQQQLAQQTQTLAQAKAQAETATTAAAKQAEERAAQVQQLTQAKEAADKLATDRQQQIEQLKEAAAQAKSAADKLVNEQHQKMEKLKDQLMHTVNISEHTSQQLGAIKKQQEQLTPLLAATSGLPNQWNAFAEALFARLAGTETTLAQINKQLAPEQLRGMLLPTLTEKLQEQGGTQKDHLKEVETRFRTELGKGLGNAVKQIEAFVSIQNYLTTGESISGFHGWPISPDIGLFLIEKIRERQYDLIIEFGSGTSTILISKAFNKEKKSSNFKETDDLKKLVSPILTFEHSAKYLKETKIALAANRNPSNVALIHAPLIDWNDGDINFLFYDCESHIKDLAAEIKETKKRILIFIDGPPGGTCPNARYPAIPIIFKHLGMHAIDIVLDDANRPEEKSIISSWKVFWKKRSIQVTEELVSSEKGIYFASTL